MQTKTQKTEHNIDGFCASTMHRPQQNPADLQKSCTAEALCWISANRLVPFKMFEVFDPSLFGIVKELR